MPTSELVASVRFEPAILRESQPGPAKRSNSRPAAMPIINRMRKTTAGLSMISSHRLLELEHEPVGRLGRRLHREVRRGLRMAPEIALRDELEPGRLDLAAQRALLDAMERLA